MTSTEHYDNDQTLNMILAAGEVQEIGRIRTGLRLDAGLAAITQGNSRLQTPKVEAGDSGEPQILPESTPHPVSPLERLTRASSQHCVLFAVDVAGLFAPRRDTEMLLFVRKALYRALVAAFKHSQLDWDNCMQEDRGDGLLIIVPTEMPSATIIGPLLDHLGVSLRRHNHLTSDIAQIRLRIAIHSGQVNRDSHGLAGPELIHLFRLLDSPALKRALTQSGDDLAVIASDHFYDTVIRQAYDTIDPETFQPAMVTIKETRTCGWLHLPQSSPQRPRVRAPKPYTGLRPVKAPTMSSGSEQSGIETPPTPEILAFRWVPEGR